MVSYFNRLESLIEKWQSRRKTIEISRSSSSTSITKPGSDKSESLNSSCFFDEDKENEYVTPARTAIKLSNQEIRKKNQNEVLNVTKVEKIQFIRPNHQLAICPSLLYVTIVIVSFLCQHGSRYDITLATPMTESANNLNGLQISKAITANLIQQLGSTGKAREGWTKVNDLSPILNNQWSYLRNRKNYLSQTINRISNRIGARNTIRVHNAFRDLAWRILSRLSMPTPVIYELRRQNFYSPEEEQMNDSLFNKNTTKSIRSKRLLEELWPSLKATTSVRRIVQRASDDDDDEPENFRERFRMRLEDLMNLSRRSLFGRVIRLPTLFPFKRQEDEDKVSKAPGGSARRRFLKRRKKKETTDRQLISINGKQYYVNEDGELKELDEKS